MPTYNTGLLPTSTGLALGSPTQQWIAYLSNVFITTFTSNSSPVAQSGVIRLGSNLGVEDAIAWRNNANTGDVSLAATGPAAGNVPADALSFTGSGIVSDFISNSANPAVAGAVRLSASDLLNFRNQTNTADIPGLLHNSDDSITVGGSGGVELPANLSVVGNLRIGSIGNIDNVMFVDGVTFASSMAGIKAAHDALPSGGGIIILPPGTYQGTSTINFTKPIVLLGSGRDATTIQLTTTGSSLHGIVAAANLVVRDCGFSIQTPPASNLFMKAIDMDTASAGVGGGGPNLQLVVDNVKIRGFNIGIFADGRTLGLASFFIDQFVVSHCDIQITSVVVPAGGSNNCIFVAGCNHAAITDNDLLDNQSTGDHVIYGIQNKVFIVRGNKIINTTGAGSCGIKADMQTPSGSGNYPLWSFTDNEFTNLSTGILAAPTDTAVLGLLYVAGNSFHTITDTTASKWGVQLNPAQTSIIAHAVFEGNKFDDLQQGAIVLDAGASAIIRNVKISDTFVRDFSKSASGAAPAITASSASTYPNVSLTSLRTDGNTTGKSAFDFTGATLTRLHCEDVTEVNMTGASVMPAYTIIELGTTDPTAGGGVAAAQGCIGLRTNGAASTTLYVKTGAAATAWTAK